MPLFKRVFYIFLRPKPILSCPSDVPLFKRVFYIFLRPKPILQALPPRTLKLENLHALAIKSILLKINSANLKIQLNPISICGPKPTCVVFVDTSDIDVKDGETVFTIPWFIELYLALTGMQFNRNSLAW